MALIMGMTLLVPILQACSAAVLSHQGSLLAGASVVHNIYKPDLVMAAWRMLTASPRIAHPCSHWPCRRFRLKDW